MLESLRTFEIPGRLTIANGHGGLPKFTIQTDRSSAEIYPHGAHVTGFQKKDEPPLLFMSQSSQFADGKPIRGGVPIVFPWFGARDGAPAHGFARLVAWKVRETAVTPNGVRLAFDLPEPAAKTNGVNARVSFVVTVEDRLTMELVVTNSSAGESFSFENCLHTYFAVSDIGEIFVAGLKGVPFLDRLDPSGPKVEYETIRVRSEVDRIYPDSAGLVEIHDAKFRRAIRVEKSGSVSTVVWNPWVAKAKAMPDFGDDEFKQMICVESGNVGQDKLTLPPGNSATLKVTLSSRAI